MRLHESDRRKIGTGMQKYIFTPQRAISWRINIVCDDQLVSGIVNVQDALAIGSEQTKQLSTSLSSDFHELVKKKEMKSMEAIGKAVYVRGNHVQSAVCRGSSATTWM